jgi:hypothetical protein
MFDKLLEKLLLECPPAVQEVVGSNPGRDGTCLSWALL